MLDKLEIVGLYEYNDVYQVIDSTDSVLFQGSKSDCKRVLKSLRRSLLTKTKNPGE